MRLKLYSRSGKVEGKIAIGGSKSETNRLLLLQAFCPNIVLENESESDDSKVLKKALTEACPVIDVHHAGTAMRFLTAFFAMQPHGSVVLTGSDRMKQRPVSILVDALKSLGAKIEYLENEGFPPLKITGAVLTGSSVTVNAEVSSQYISALILIGGFLKQGLTIFLEGRITSLPYINMSLSLLKEAGIKAFFNDSKIVIYPVELNNDLKKIKIESDWSSASYFYSLAALSQSCFLELSVFKDDSFQGDAAVASIYKNFGVETTFKDGSVFLFKKQESKPEITNLVLDLKETPDLAQTLAVTCFGLGIGCEFTGLHTLKIKETDRLSGLKKELEKLGASVEITNDYLILNVSGKMNNAADIDTYNDHRMAMAFAPLALKTTLIINDAEVVSKSYPGFWDDLKKTGVFADEIYN